MYCRCGKTVHPVRIDLGYKTCVECSTTQTYSYVPIIEHKTGNTIQIVSQEVSASVHRAWRRKQLEGAAVSGRLQTYMIKGVIPDEGARNGSMIVG